MTETTKSKFFEFLDFASNKGLVSPSTISSWKAGAAAALEDTSNDYDISVVDIDLELHKYNNRNPGKVKPDTLRRYKSWAIAGIENFISYATNPMAYRPNSQIKKPVSAKGTTKTSRKVKDKALAQASEQTKESYRAINQLEQPSPNTFSKSSGTIVNFPLRIDFKVQIILPEDMTTIEAKRLVRVIMSYAQDLPTD